MSYITAENTKIAGELEILRSQDKRLKEKIPKMETALDKVILDSFQFSEKSGCFPLQSDVLPRLHLVCPIHMYSKILT